MVFLKHQIPLYEAEVWGDGLQGFFNENEEWNGRIKTHRRGSFGAYSFFQKSFFAADDRQQIYRMFIHERIDLLHIILVFTEFMVGDERFQIDPLFDLFVLSELEQADVGMEYVCEKPQGFNNLFIFYLAGDGRHKDMVDSMIS